MGTMAKLRWMSLSVSALICLLALTAGTRAQPHRGWLDSDPAAIWSRAPGFYEDGGQWYAILHARPDIRRVRLVGDFTDDATGGVDLTSTPDGKFWWFKGKSADFARPPRARDCYRFELTRRDGTTQRIQDPAARQVESSNLGACSRVTISSDYVWHDSSWHRPGWEYYLIYELHPLRFSNRNTGLTPLKRVTEELNGDGQNDYINNLHVTAVELMPVNEFQGDFSWGYNPSFFDAVESSYGTPDQLKELVDTAHQHGIAVVLDLEVNHGGNGDNILWQAAQDDITHGTYYNGDTVWGPMVHFADDVARHFFVQNAVSTLYPAGNLSRKTNGSALSGSPYRAAICAPFGSTGGAAVQLRFSGCAITCWSSAIAADGSSTAIAIPAIKPNLFMKAALARGFIVPPLL